MPQWQTTVITIEIDEWRRLRGEVARRQQAGEASASMVRIIREALVLYWQQHASPPAPTARDLGVE